MATIASLNIDLAANTAKFQAGLGKAKSSLTSFASSVASFAGGSLLAQGISSAVSGMKNLVVQSFESIDSVAKMSDKVGIATEELLGFQYAASQAGVGTETFNSAMIKMQKVIGEASIGTKGSVEALEAIGISVDDITKMKPGEAFKLISDNIKNLASPAMRVAAAMDVFGKSGTELIPLLIQGSEGLEEMAKRNDELGGSFSRIDAEKVVMAGDAMQDLGKFIENVAKHIAIELSPFIKAATDELINFGTQGDTMGNKVTGAFEMVAKGIAVVADYFELLKAAWYAVQAGLTLGIGGVLTIFKNLGSVIDTIYEKVTGEDLGISSSIGEFTNGLAVEAENSLKQFDQAWANFQNGAASEAVSGMFENIKNKATQAATASATAAADAAKVVTDPLASFIDDYYQKMEKLEKLGAKIFDRTRTPLEKFKAEMLEIAEAFKEDFIDEDTFERAAKMAQDQIEKSKKADKAKSDGSFRQIDTQNISVEGLKSRKEVQQVKDPQLEKTNAILNEIRKNIGLQQPVLGA